MSEYNKVMKDAEDRGEKVAPILPGANWITINGNFTPNELRAIADEVNRKFAEVFRGNGDKD